MANAIVTAPLAPTASVPDEPLFEIVNGERKEISPMGILAGSLASVLSHILAFFAMQKKLGLVVVEVLFLLRPINKSRRPDVAFVSYERMPGVSVPPEDPAEWDVVPNLAIEVISPTNTADEVETKIIDYFQAGVELVWVIYPRQKRIHVYASPTSASILAESDELEGGTVLPGFRVKITDLYDLLAKPSP